MIISKLINPMNQFGRMGKIHSVFTQSFMIKVNNQLIHFGNYRQYISSFGTYIERQQYDSLKPYLKVGNIVRVTTDTFTIYSNAGVKTIETEFKELDLKVYPLPFNDKLIVDLTNLLETKIENMHTGLSLDEAFDSIQKNLMTKKLNELDWNRVIKFLIGRGKGLTPSGDDLIIGYLFVMKMLSPERAETLSQALINYPLSTTDVSKAYLLSCVKGHVSSPLHEFYKAIQEEADIDKLSKHITKIMRIGHTSGRDMTLGIKIGMDYIFNVLKS